MDYPIDKYNIYMLVDREVSQAADSAYAEDGASLYDSVRLTEKDRPLVDGLVEEATAELVRRLSDICKQGARTETTRILSFDIPDFDTQREPELYVITLYHVLYAANGVFKQRVAAIVPEYTQRVQAMLDSVETLLRSRKAPTR